MALPGCGGEESGAGGSRTTPEDGAAAPWGLAEVVLPNEKAKVQALFDGLPSEVAGRARSRPPHLSSAYIDVPYGSSRRPPLYLRAIPIEELRAFAEQTSLTLLQFLRLSVRGDAQIDETGLDPKAPVVYVIGRTTEISENESRVLYTATWGQPDGQWLFVAVGESPELRAAAVEAFVAATNPRDRS